MFEHALFHTTCIALQRYLSESSLEVIQSDFPPSLQEPMRLTFNMIGRITDDVIAAFTSSGQYDPSGLTQMLHSSLRGCRYLVESLYQTGHIDSNYRTASNAVVDSYRELLVMMAVKMEEVTMVIPPCTCESCAPDINDVRDILGGDK